MPWCQMSLKSTKKKKKKNQTPNQSQTKNSVLVYSFLEVEAGGTEAPGHPQLHEKT